MVGVLAAHDSAYATRRKLRKDAYHHFASHQEIAPFSDQDPPVDLTAEVVLREDFAYDGAAMPLKQIIALDTRYAGNRHSRGCVLYTAEARDLEAADVVLVITRNGDDVSEYVEYAQPGQVRMCTASCLTLIQSMHTTQAYTFCFMLL